MVSETDESVYPSPRKALFGNGHVANIRCAIKYMLWQLSHVPLALFGLLMMLLTRVASTLGSTRIARGTTSVKERVTGSSQAKYVSRKAIDASFGLLVLLWAGILVYMAVTQFYVFLITIGFVIFIVMSIAGGIIIEETTRDARQRTSERLGLVSSKTKETPVVRRVYGKCPVHWSIDPKWYERLLDR